MFLPFYMRQMSILEKIKKEPGITQEGILDRFSVFEREEVDPPLTPLLLDILLDEMLAVDYIEVRDGKIFPKTPRLNRASSKRRKGSKG
jgi:hypothetical protein